MADDEGIGGVPENSPEEKSPMHDFIIALVFIGMVVAPAVVAAKSGSAEGKIE
jgi:hypothetical protein